MALKKVSSFQKWTDEVMKKREEEKKMQEINNSEKEQVIEKVEETIQEVIGQNTSNTNYDSFFKEEVLQGDNTAIQGLELELDAEQIVKEGKYKFSVKNVGIENGVITRYGIKNKLVVEYHINGMVDGHRQKYDLKQKYNISNSSKSKFYNIYRDLMGLPPIGKINLRNLLGIEGVCEVKHLELDNGDMFPEIINVNRAIEEE